MNEKLKALKSRAEAAREKFEQDHALLYRDDGARLLGDEPHKEKLAEITNERNETLRQIEEEVREEGAALDAKAANIKNRDSAELLTEEELRTANARRDFAHDAASALDVSGLAQRLRSVLASEAGDKGVVFAYLNAAERRRQDILRARRSSGVENTATDLDEVLDQMRTFLDPNAAAEIAAAEEDRGSAVGLELEVANLKAGARNSAEAWINRRFASLSR